MTDHAPAPISAAGDVPPQDSPVATNTWPMWVIAFLPLLSAANNQVPFPDPGMAALPRMFADVSAALPIAILLAVIVLARLDHRILQQRGVHRPMPWGWAILDAVYVIGRFVVVRRWVRGSLAPLWVWIGSTLVLLIAVSLSA